MLWKMYQHQDDDLDGAGQYTESTYRLMDKAVALSTNGIGWILLRFKKIVNIQPDNYGKFETGTSCDFCIISLADCMYELKFLDETEAFAFQNSLHELMKSARSAPALKRQTPNLEASRLDPVFSREKVGPLQFEPMDITSMR